MTITGYGTSQLHTATLLDIHGGYQFKALDWAQTPCGDTQSHSYRLEARTTGLSIFCDSIVSPIITRNDFNAANFVMSTTRSVTLGYHWDGNTGRYCRVDGTFSNLVVMAAPGTQTAVPLTCGARVCTYTANFHI